jgi:hypothetical protein
MISSALSLALLVVGIAGAPQGAPAPAPPQLPQSGENGQMGGIFGMGSLSLADLMLGSPSAAKGGTGT